MCVLAILIAASESELSHAILTFLKQPSKAFAAENFYCNQG